MQSTETHNSQYRNSTNLSRIPILHCTDINECEFTGNAKVTRDLKVGLAVRHHETKHSDHSNVQWNRAQRSLQVCNFFGTKRRKICNGRWVSFGTCIPVDNPDHPRLDSGILGRLMVERLLDLLIGKGCNDPNVGEAALVNSNPSDGTRRRCEITIPCLSTDCRRLRSHGHIPGNIVQFPPPLAQEHFQG